MLHLALRCLAAAKSRQSYVLNVLGDGSQEESCRKMADASGLGASVIWHGRQSRERCFEIMDKSHLLFLTSMYDVNPTVVWEAMSMCVPVLSTASKGLNDFLNPENSFLIDNSSCEKVCEDFTEMLDYIAENRNILQEKAQYLDSYRHLFTWDRRQEFFLRLYDAIR